MDKFIDLSVAIESGLPSDPPMMIPKIMYVDHASGAEIMKSFYPGLTAGDLPGGLGWAVESMEVSTHAGTHMDAPWHFHPTQDQGKPALTIDKFPLEWGVGSGVKIDFSDFPDGYNITIADIKAKLDKIGHILREGDVFLAQSGAAPFWGTPEYLFKGCDLAARQRSGFLVTVCMLSGRMAGAGTGHFLFRLKNLPRQRMPQLSGKGILLVLKKVISRLKSSLI